MSDVNVPNATQEPPAANPGSPSVVRGVRALLRSIGDYAAGLLMTVLLGSLQAYKLLISPLLGSRCRFHPSCSVYAQQSLQRFGPIKGGWLAIARLARCGPWHSGGIDEVPISNRTTNRTRA